MKAEKSHIDETVEISKRIADLDKAIKGLRKERAKLTDILFKNYPRGTYKNYQIPEWIDRAEVDICQSYDMPTSNLHIKTRKREIVDARQLLMTMLLFNNCSLSVAGGYYGLDHATSLHAKKKVIERVITMWKSKGKNILEVLDKYNQIPELLKNMFPSEISKMKIRYKEFFENYENRKLQDQTNKNKHETENQCSECKVNDLSSADSQNQ